MYVIKVGGSLREEIPGVCDDIQSLWRQGESVVLVHGGSGEADRLARELGRPTRHLTSAGGHRSRYTDAAALDTLTMAMLGRVKPGLVSQLVSRGVPAVGLSGIDGGLVVASKTAPARALVDGVPCVVRDDLTGRVASVEAGLLRTLLAGGFLPVVSPPAMHPSLGPLSIDADRLAATLAVALLADWLIVLSDVPGLLRDPADRSSLVATVSTDDPAQYLGLAEGRMRVKLKAANEACLAGVPHVVLGDGRRRSPVLAARDGAGTTFVRGEGP